VTILTSLLLHLGDAAQWLWHALCVGAVWAWALVDAILNPVLSPVLLVLNRLSTYAGDAVFAALAPLPPWLGLTLLSVILGVLMLAAFRYTSNQVKIGRTRDELTAHLLSLKLFKDDLGVTWRAQGRLLHALARLQVLMLKPVLILLLPLLLVVGQMGLRYQWRPLRPGEETLIRLRLRSTADDKISTARLDAGQGLADIVGPVPGGGQLVWRVRGGIPGRHTLRFTIAGRIVEKDLVVGGGLARVSAERPPRRWTSQILHPAEVPLPPDSPVRSIEIAYGGVDSHIRGANWWVLYFFVVSMAAALAVKPVLRVRL